MTYKWKSMSSAKMRENRYLIGVDKWGNVREISFWRVGDSSGWEYHGGNAFHPVAWTEMPVAPDGFGIEK